MFVVKQRYKNLPFYIFSISLDDFNELRYSYEKDKALFEREFRKFDAVSDGC